MYRRLLQLALTELRGVEAQIDALNLEMAGADGQKAQSRVTFLLNFFDDVRRQVPVGR